MGHFQIFREFASPAEGFTRTVRIYIPDAYESAPEQRFPVLYLNDGQNVFSHPESAFFDTWCANVALERVVGEGRTEPWLLVGVDAGLGRLAEYSPWDEPRNNIRAQGEAYARFLVETLKPFVDSQFRTRQGPEWTGVMGSSMGGLMALYLGWKYPHLFGRIGALSPTVMWSHNRLFQEWTEHTRRWSRIYLDAGAEELFEPGGWTLRYGEGTRDFYQHLKHLGYADHELQLVLEPGGQHHELAWQRRLPMAMGWLLS